MQRHRSTFRILLACTITVAGALSFVRVEADAGLQVAGFMPFALKAPVSFGAPPNAAVRFVVDPGTHRGFLLVKDGEGARIAVYDLARLERIAFVPWPPGVSLTGNEGAAVDAVHHRIYLTDVVADQLSQPGPKALACDHGTRFVIVDTARLTSSAAYLPCIQGLPFAVDGLSYDAGSNKLYVIGMYAHEYSALSSSAANFTVEPTRIAQLDPGTLRADWAVDASTICEWHEVGAEGVVAVVGRSGDNLISFCYRGGATYNFGGTRGQAVVLPLKNDKPVTTTTGPDFRTSPTYTDSVTPTLDPATGRLLLYSAHPPYGRAVWGYDAIKERFFGVVPGGEPSSDVDDRFVGFDATTGRLYLTNPKGIVQVDARQPVLSGGVTYPTLAGSRGGKPDSPAPTGFSHDIGIDGRLRRLFFPYPKRGGFVVVADGVPVPSGEDHPDLDQGTADIAEVPGKTQSAFSGAADAWGAHLVVVGGIPGAIDNLDQTCFPTDASLPSPRNLDRDRRCLADQLVTAGNRESYVAQTGAELGSDSGALGFGAVFRFPADDSATDADFRSLAMCFADRAPAQVPSKALGSVASFCRDHMPFSQFQNGTHNKDGTDVPFPGSACVDETQARDAHDSRTKAGTSSAECDLAAMIVKANADAAAVALPDASSPAISIAHASSSVVSTRTSEGLVTTVTATVTGVRIAGIFSIGRIYAEAVTKARGRTGTTVARFKRLISDVHGPGVDCASTCDPQAVVDAFNRAFASQGRMRLSLPLASASPHGYQGLVVKDPGLRASDVAILNDDTDTFDGLDLIINNDGVSATTNGPNARSRIVVEFAGVHAESRYGIFPVSTGGGGTSLPSVPPIPGLPIPSPIATTNGPLPIRPLVPPLRMPPIARVFTDTWRLIVNHPAQAALLFVLLGLFATPVYLGLRSRSLAKSLGP